MRFPIFINGFDDIEKLRKILKIETEKTMYLRELKTQIDKFYNLLKEGEDMPVYLIDNAEIERVSLDFTTNDGSPSITLE
jgi:hypothetical protein